MPLTNGYEKNNAIVGHKNAERAARPRMHLYAVHGPEMISYLEKQRKPGGASLKPPIPTVVTSRNACRTDAPDLPDQPYRLLLSWPTHWLH